MKSGRGGARPGSGRKKGYRKKDPKVSINLRLNPHIAKWLKSQNMSQAKLIEKALTEHYCLNNIISEL